MGVSEAGPGVLEARLGVLEARLGVLEARLGVLGARLGDSPMRFDMVFDVETGPSGLKAKNIIFPINILRKKIKSLEINHGLDLMLYFGRLIKNNQRGNATEIRFH